MIDKRGQFALCTGAVVYGAKNKQEDSPWVVLPVASFDAGFGTTAFSKKGWLRFPPRLWSDRTSILGCRYQVREEWVEGMEIQ